MDQDHYLHELLALPRLLVPQVSPDGRWIAWTWFGISPAADVYVAPTDGSSGAVRLTETSNHTMLVSWTPDSSAVVVGQDHDGDERVQLFKVHLDAPLALEPLTEPSPPFFLRGGRQHPNGKWLIYGANYDAERGVDIEPTWLYRHDLETGDLLALARPEKPCYYVPELNTQGTHILYNRKDRHASGLQVWLVDIEGREDREVLNFGDAAKVYASWMPDGARAVVLAEHGSYLRMGVWDRSTGETSWLIDQPDRNLQDAYMPEGSDKIVVVEVAEATIRASLFDPAGAGEEPIEDVSGNLVPLAPSAGGEWVGQYYSSQQPADVASFSLEEGRLSTLRSLTGVWEQTGLKSSDMARAQSYRWKSVDGLDISGWLYTPEGEPKGTIVYIHGGPTSHSENKINIQVQFFVSQGFNVLDPNYRGSTGFSLAFTDAIKEDGWGGREQDDIRTGIEALIADGIAQPGKVGVTGTSYGGYSSWCAITRWPTSIVAASAPICGMTDLVVDYRTTRPDLRPYSEEMLGGTPEQVPARYYKSSPINFVGNIEGKLLIVQGLQDPNVTPENVKAVEAALKKANVAYELLAFEDEGHGIAKPKNQEQLFKKLVSFFSQAFVTAE
ncbi:MAG: prolyl oligopeptidase family serine peptidase [Chloroflexota bacterium]|nr:prolyl oligopeptidase family serine peptidase [Chloroflexota bacterium]